MSLFAGLFGGVFSNQHREAGGGGRSTSSGGTGSPQRSSGNVFTLARLNQLYERLLQFKELDMEPSGGDAIVEIVQKMTEILLWGEQNNPQLFDFFCEKNMLYTFVTVLANRRAPKKVKLQVLQTTGMLVQNIRRETSVYFLLSNRHVNHLMSTPLDFEDEEILAYYITLMKSLAMRLNAETIKFFFIELPEPTFPLYIEATKFFSHRDHMVRATVRTITLQVYRMEDKPMRRFVLRHAAQSYFTQLAYHLRDLWLRLDAAVSKTRGEDDMSAVHRENELQQDLQIYLSDVFELGVAELNEVLANRLLGGVLLPLLLASLSPSRGKGTAGAGDFQASQVKLLAPNLALYLTRQVLDTFRAPVLLDPLISALLLPSVPAALAFSFPWCTEGGATDQGDVVENSLRTHFLSYLMSPEERTFVGAAAVVHACLSTRSSVRASLVEQPLSKPVEGATSSRSRQRVASKEATAEPPPIAESLSMLLEAVSSRSTWQLGLLQAFVHILLDVFRDASLYESWHQPCVQAVSSALGAAGERLEKLLQEAARNADGGSPLVDFFCEEWESHKEQLPHLSAFFAETRRMIAVQPDRRRGPEGQIAQEVRIFLFLRRMLKCLSEAKQLGVEPEAPCDPLPTQSAANSQALWAARVEVSPLEDPPEARGQFLLGSTFDMGNVDRIVCGVASSQGKQTRYMLLNPDLLILAQPDLTTPGWAGVKLRWPIWKVQSLIDRSDPRTLQLGFQSHRPGQSPGEATMCSPPAGTYFTLTLNFEDVRRCHAADMHLVKRRTEQRQRLLQQIYAFVATCRNPSWEDPRKIAGVFHI